MSDSNLAAPGEEISESERIFQKWRGRAGLFLGPVAAILMYGGSGSLSSPARDLAAIMTLVGVWWITEPIPIAATSLLGAALCVLMGVDGAKTIFAPFAHPLIFLFIGSFFIAKAMSIHGLDRRLAERILSAPWVGNRPGRVLFVFGAVTAFISMWISNTAATAMMFPIALGVLTRLNAGRSYACGFMLMAAYASSVGGIGTPVGTPPNLIGIGFISEQTGIRITFFQWMMLTAPMLAVMFMALFALLYGLHRPRSGASSWSPSAGGSTGPNLPHPSGTDASVRPTWTAGERNAAIAFGLAVILWITPGILSMAEGPQSPAAKWYDAHLNESVVALFAGCLLFVLPLDRTFGRMTLTWKEAVDIDWGTILLFGGGLAMGEQMFKTGLARAMGESLTALLQLDSLWSITGLAIAMGIVLSELTSNTASAAMVIPVAMAVAGQAGVSPLPPAIGACIGASYGFMLPVSTPPNAIVYGSKLVPISAMIRAGVIFDLAGFLIIWAGLRLLCPALGLI